jgi:hypothetical protein
VAGRVAVEPDLVALLVADQPPCRHAVNLAGDVMQRHVNSRESAAHAALPGERADRPQDRLDLQRVPAKDVRLQDQGDALDAGVAHLAEAIDALVGVDADDRVVVVGGDAACAHVGDLQRTGG